MTPQESPDYDAAEQDAQAAAAVLVSESTGWYRPWYFRNRLEQEVHRAARYNRQFSLVWLKLRPEHPARGLNPERAQQLNKLLRSLATSSIRATDLAGELEPHTYSVILPETTKSNAGIVADRLASALRAYLVAINVVAFPVDATSADGLLRLAAYQPPELMHRSGAPSP